MFHCIREMDAGLGDERQEDDKLRSIPYACRKLVAKCASEKISTLRYVLHEDRKM